MEQDGQHVYFLSADRSELFRVTEDLTQPMASWALLMEKPCMWQTSEQKKPGNMMSCLTAI